MLTAGIDIGTTSVKGVVVDDDGTCSIGCGFPTRSDVGGRSLRARGMGGVGSGAAGRPAQPGPQPAVGGGSGIDGAVVVRGHADGRPITAGLLYGDGRGRDGRRSTSSDAGELVGFLRWLVAEAPEAHGYWSAPAVANRALGGPAAVDFGTGSTSTPLFDGAGWDAAVCTDAGARLDSSHPCTSWVMRSPTSAMA